MPSWDLYRTFLAVLEEGSLSAAARRLGLTQPTVSRQIDGLETALDRTLFLRTQRGLIPTDAATALGPSARTLAAAAAAVEREASAPPGTLAGTLRISASEVMGVEVLPPILTDVRLRYPGVEIELVLSNRVDDLLRRDADIAVRMVPPTQEVLLARKVGVVSMGLFAHRTYLERREMPVTLADLAVHDFIGVDTDMAALAAVTATVPALRAADLRFALRTDSHLAHLSAIRAGMGIGFCQVALARLTPDLRAVLPDEVRVPMGTWVVMHEDLRATPRCRVVFDALVAGLRDHVDPPTV